MKSWMRPALSWAATSVLLAACGHARVVRVEDGSAARAAATTYPARQAASSSPRPAPQAVPRDGYHVVQRGETLYGISFRYGLRYQDVAAWNHLDDASRIDVGQRLRLRPTAGAPVVVAAPPPVARAPAPTAPILAPIVGPIPAPAPRPVVALPAGAPVWRWPTEGQIVGRFVAGNPTEQGIDIAGQSGQAVNAAADGVVVYSGAGLVGYGELVILKHSDQWLSAYGHNRKRLVAEGAQVNAGDVIAEMGRTGAARDMLHFEIRLNGKPVDPLQYLPARAQ